VCGFFNGAKEEYGVLAPFIQDGLAEGQKAFLSVDPGRSDAHRRSLRPRLDGLPVLVVDDDADARELVIIALESCGARTLVAASAAEGLRVLADRRPDVLVTDIAMPEQDGCEFLRRVRQLSPDEGGLTPAAALTACASEGDRRIALRSGFQAHIAKPAHPADLVAIVSRLAAREPERAHQ
jgi:CheY-like chemotaxis protein